VRIFIVDDHAVVRYGLSRFLSEGAEVQIVGEAAGAPGAISGIEREKPDLVICDLSLSDGDGMELIKDIRARWPQIRILVSSMYADPTYVERAMRAGANGYLTKDQQNEDLVEAIGQVLRGGIYICPDLSDTIMRRALQGEDGLRTSAIDKLSDRELQVFEMIGKGMPTRKIADSLSLSVKTIETYREKIKQKLLLDSGNDLIHRAVRWVMQREIGQRE
jgi:DNA-binding NarL/FixJ family response regulator